MGAYNPNLNYFLARLQGVSTNYFKLEPQSSGSSAVTANKIIRFSLPSNCLLNTRGISFHFNADANLVATRGGRIAPDVSSFIDRVELSSGGVQIAQGMNGYGTFVAMKRGIVCDKCDPTLGHPELVRVTSYVDGFGDAGTSALATGENESYLADGGQVPFAITNWEGFLGSVQPSIIDTSLLSDLTLTLYLAGNEVCSSSAGVLLGGNASDNITTAHGTGQASYQIKDFHLIVETLGLADSVYDNMIESRIAEVGYIELPFKSYTSFSDVHNGTTRFTNSSQSLDRVYATFRASGFDVGPKGAVAVQGYKKSGAFLSLTTAGATYTQIATTDVGMPQYDLGGVLNTNSEKYKTAFFNFAQAQASASVPATYQFSFNSSMLPQFKASAEQMLAITRNSVPTIDTATGKYPVPVLTLDQYKKNYFVMCVRLCLPQADELREISGLDSRGISLNSFLSTSGFTNGSNIFIVCESTSSLRIGLGRSIEVIA